MPRAIDADGSRTDEAHASAQNADQLRQAIKPKVAQQANETHGSAGSLARFRTPSFGEVRKSWGRLET